MLFGKREKKIIFFGIMIYERFAWEEKNFRLFHAMYVRYVVNSDFSEIGDFHNHINFHAIKKFCAIQPHEGLLLKYGVSFWVCTWGRQCLLGAKNK